LVLDIAIVVTNMMVMRYACSRYWHIMLYGVLMSLGDEETARQQA